MVNTRAHVDVVGSRSFSQNEIDGETGNPPGGIRLHPENHCIKSSSFVLCSVYKENFTVYLKQHHFRWRTHEI